MTSKPMFESLESRVLLSATTTVWVIDGLDHATVYNSAHTTGIGVSAPDLLGAVGDNVFVFADNSASLSGTIVGGTGNNTLHYGAYSNETYDISTTGYTDGVAVDIGWGEATGMSGFSNINSVVGGSGSNLLTGPDTGTVWAVTGLDSGSVGENFSFQNFSQLVGGNGTDDFFFGTNGSLSGSLTGGEGSDSLNFSATNTSLYCNITLNNTGNIAGGTTLNFSSIENLTGSQAADTFTFSDNVILNGDIDGEGGSDRIHVGAYTSNTNWTITGPNAGSFEGSEGFISVENITGGAGNDTFTFVGSDAYLSGTADGGSGADTIDLSQAASLSRTWSFLASSNAYMEDSQGTHPLASFENLIGGSGDDVFNIYDNAATNMSSVQGGAGINTLSMLWYTTDTSWVIDSNYTGNVVSTSGTFAFDSIQQAVGGQAADTFTFADQAKMQSVDGQGGNDTLDLQAYSTMFQIVLTDANRGDGQGMMDYPNPSNYVMDFQSIQTIQDNTQVAGQFGRTDGRKNVKLTVQDSNGTPVTFALSGVGIGTVIAGPTFFRVELTGTDIKSTLTITTPKGTTTTLFGISSDSSLGNIIAKTSNLAGEIYVNGSLRSATMANATAGAFVNVLGETTVSSLTFSRVQDMSVALAGGLNKFTATEWLDTDAKNDTFTADWINQLVTKGAKDNKKTVADESSAGNFQADLSLSGQGASRYTLNNANIAGALSNTDWYIDGRINSVRASVGVTDWALDELASGITGINTLNLGDVQSADVTVLGGINNITTQRWLSGTINAATVKSLKAAGKKATRTTSAISGDFQAAVNLSGPTNPSTWTVTSAYIAGDWNNSQWNVTGKVNSFRVHGTAQSSRLQTTGDIRTLNLGATDGSDFLAGVNKSFTGRYSENRSDFVNASAKIGTIKITGIKGAVSAMPLVTDSHFTAAGFNGVYFMNTEFANVGLHVLGGESNIRFIRHTDKADRSNNWTWKPGKVPPNYTTEPLISEIA